MNGESGPAQSRYDALSHRRSAYIERARECSALTIPSIFPAEDNHSGNTGSQQLKTPWQSVGARGLNNLASKLLLALFPPNAPFFKLGISPHLLKQQAAEQGVGIEDIQTKVDSAFAEIERMIQSSMEAASFRVAAFEALRLLVGSGNVLLYLPKSGGIKVYRLDRYVVKRDPMGNVVEIIVKESMTLSTLPESIRKIVADKIKSEGGPEQESEMSSVDVYTYVQKKEDKWHVYQEVKGVRVPNSKGEYPLDKSPWIPLRFIRVDGEDYGRGYIEEYMGDLRSLNSLMKAIVTGALGAAKQIWAVRPGSLIRPRDLQKESGSIVVGDVDDVGVIQANKAGDFSVAYQAASTIEERLSFAFLLAHPRDAERVTAEEIRLMAGMLEDALGGVYSVLSQEFQRPLVNRYMHVLEQKNELPNLPADLVQLSIVTGIEALGRGHDLQRLDLFVRGTAEALGPAAIETYIKPTVYLRERANALGVKNEIIRSDEEVAEMKQAAQMQQMAQRVGPEVVKQAGNAMSEANQQQQEPPQV